MELCTVSKNICARCQAPIYINVNETFLPDFNVNKLFRLVFIEEGAGLMRVNNHLLGFVAPAVFCLNDTDLLIPERVSNFHAQSIYFHPRVINSGFNFINSKNESESFSLMETQDLILLTPFVMRDSNYKGYVHVGPLIAPRMMYIFKALYRELENQSDMYWLSRSRSFFIEFLNLLQQIYSYQLSIGENTLHLKFNDANKVITYLQANYHRKVTIEELTKTFHINRTSLTEQFYSVTNLTIINYLIKLRVNLAAAILRNTSIPISEVMERVGFKDSSHFWRMFRKHMGTSPNQYRQTYCRKKLR